jgi:hypothetical protein
MTLRLSSACSNQLSYTPTLQPFKSEISNLTFQIPVGGADEDRTRDLLLAKQALSQLSYGPEGANGQALAPFA